MMEIPGATFKKTERLCSLKAIEDLFENGNTFYTPLFKVVWQKSSEVLPFPSRIAFSVPKKRFRLAVDRNLIKRRMREAYRRQKSFMYGEILSLNTQVILVVIYRGSGIADFNTINNSVKDMIIRLLNYLKTDGKS